MKQEQKQELDRVLASKLEEYLNGCIEIEYDTVPVNRPAYPGAWIQAEP